MRPVSLLGLFLAITLAQGAVLETPLVNPLDSQATVTMEAAAEPLAAEPAAADPFDSTVPEPATLVMIGMGLIGLSTIGRRHRRR